MSLVPLTVRFDDETELPYIKELANRMGEGVSLAEAVRMLVRDSRSREYLEDSADDIIEQLSSIISSLIRIEFKNMRTLLASGAIESATATLITEKALLLLADPDKRQALLEMYEQARINAYQKITNKKELRTTLESMDESETEK